ncbi:MAG: HAD family hydrolase [Candidatus Riflebacteria bacterium]|nr:HAD family hydrolase [Candidatus Riflebacteria bacterium]
MDLQAILFDVNGTLIDIETEDESEETFSILGRFLIYQGIALAAHEIRGLYLDTMKRQRVASSESFPEFDATGIWREILDGQWMEKGCPIPGERREQLPLFLAELHRGIAMRRLVPYPDVAVVLEALKSRYSLAIVTDAQSAYARTELAAVGLLSYFDHVVVSGDKGYRKPDRRLFADALGRVHALPEQAIFVGNDMYRDVFGARELGMKTVFFPTEWGEKHHEGTEPDYVIHRFAQLLDAVEFLAAR